MSRSLLWKACRDGNYRKFRGILSRKELNGEYLPKRERDEVIEAMIVKDRLDFLKLYFQKDHLKLSSKLPILRLMLIFERKGLISYLLDQQYFDWQDVEIVCRGTPIIINLRIERNIIFRFKDVLEVIQSPSHSTLPSATSYDTFNADQLTQLLKVAVECNKPRIVETLINWGADHRVRDHFGPDHLFRIAADRGYQDIIRVLLEKGVDISSKDHFGPEAAMRGATERGHLDIVKMLVKSGADIHISDVRGPEAPLRGAVMANQLKVAKYLLDQGADLHQLPEWVYLHVIKNEYTELLLLFLSMGFPLTIPEGCPPKSLAVLRKYAAFKLSCVEWCEDAEKLLKLSDILL